MTTMIAEKTPTNTPDGGSIFNKYDRVCFIYGEDETGGEEGYGTVIGQKDADTAIVLVVLKGRRKEIRDELEIPYSQLKPHLPESKND